MPARARNPFLLGIAILAFACVASLLASVVWPPAPANPTCRQLRDGTTSRTTVVRLTKEFDSPSNVTRAEVFRIVKALARDGVRPLGPLGWSRRWAPPSRRGPSRNRQQAAQRTRGSQALMCPRVAIDRGCRTAGRPQKEVSEMTSLRQWLGVQTQASLGVAVALFLCSPDGRRGRARGRARRGWGKAQPGWNGPPRRPHVQRVAGLHPARRQRQAVDHDSGGRNRAPCTKGGSATFKDQWRYVAVRRGTFKAVYRDSFTDEGATIEVDDSFTGRVNRARTAITGTWRNKMVVREPDGSVDTCDSGVLRFTARR